MNLLKFFCFINVCYIANFENSQTLYNDWKNLNNQFFEKMKIWLKKLKNMNEMFCFQIKLLIDQIIRYVRLEKKIID